MCNLYSITMNQAAIRKSVQSRVYDTTGALAVRRAKSWMKLAEPKEAPLKKPDKDMFDPKNFLAKVGTGKQVLEFHKNQHVFEQGDVADTVFYIQKGSVKVTVMSEQGKEAVVGIVGPGQFFGEGCMNGHKLCISTAMARDDCRHQERRDVGRPS
jgi:CRP-like cAMP-binding protein